MLGLDDCRGMLGVLRPALVYSRRQVVAALHFVFRFEDFV
jgi:hypothetical protein